MKFIKLCFLIVSLSLVVGCSNATNDNKELNEKRLDYSLIPNITFYVLNQEYFENEDKNNPGISVLYRIYQKYDGSNNSVSDEIVSVSIPNRVDSIIEAKQFLKDNHSEWLKLKPSTIIGQQVLDQWTQEGYQPQLEYWEGSPKNITYEQLLK